MSTVETTPEPGKKVAVKRDVVGPDHPHRRVARDPRGHRLREPQVQKCYSTSMIFRGFDIFMKGIDPRDTHFLTSRICGICGDNHCTSSVLYQNMAYGVYPPKLGNCAFNLAEQADYMFDHAIYNDCMCNVDFCEQMVKDTNPSLLAKAEKTSSPHGDIHGYKTIADIMRALNPFTGEFYLETLQVARYTREMYCLFGGRHTHPSTIMPGGCQRGHHAPDVHGLLRAAHALHGLLQAHRADARRHLRLLPPGAAGLRHGRLPEDGPRVLGRVRRPGRPELRLQGHDGVGPAPGSHAGPRVRRRADHDRPGRDQPRDPDPARLELLRRLDQRGDVRHPRPARQPGRQAPPVEQGDAAQAAGARLRRQVLVGRVAAHVRQAQRHLRRERHRRRPVRPPVGDREGRPRRHRLPEGDRRVDPHDAARRPASCRRWSSSGRSRRSPTRSSATARGPTTRRTRRCSPSTRSRRR